MAAGLEVVAHPQKHTLLRLTEALQTPSRLIASDCHAGLRRRAVPLQVLFRQRQLLRNFLPLTVGSVHRRAVACTCAVQEVTRSGGSLHTAGAMLPWVRCGQAGHAMSRSTQGLAASTCRNQKAG